MDVVERGSLAGISSVVVDGEVHDIGLLKDFHGHPVLKEFVPEVGRLSLSWVRLAPGQELAVHEHPTKSMIIVAEGEGHTQGDLTQDIRAGDIVIVPPGSRHGFVGAGPSGFWALSVQFEGEGLYEDRDNPRVSFIDEADVDAVRAENDRYLKEFQDNALVRLVAGLDARSPEVRAALLDHLQAWSDTYQRVIAARVAAESDGPARLLADEHLAEEIGHNALLAELRDRRQVRWDPVIAAASSWFVDRMTASSTVDRIVLSHLVLEGSGLVFHSAALPAFPESRYFELHDGADAEHLDMGYRALVDRRDWTPAQVGDMLRQGWQMIGLLCERIADLARQATGDA